MGRRTEIRKARSALYTAAADVIVFTGLALLFLIFHDSTGGFHTPAFWIFLAATLAGWYMIADYSLTRMIVSDEGITVTGIFGHEKTIPMEKISTVAAEKNFFFVYDEKNKVLTSMDANIHDNEDACAILRSHEVLIVDRNYRKRS